jgi:predicted kinase
MKPTVYIFRGAPATGKGTVVPEFCKLLPKPVALIEQDALRWNFHLIGRKVSEVTDEEHVLANKNTEMLYEQYLKNGKYTVVVEGLFTWDNEASSQGSAKKLAEIARNYGFDVVNVVLKADKETLLARNAARTYVVPLDEFDMLYANVYETVDDSEMVIDSTGKAPEETMASLASLIKKEGHR